MEDIDHLKNKLSGQMSRLISRSNASNLIDYAVNHTQQVNSLFDEYAEKMSTFGNSSDEVEWNILTANEFVSSIQQTTGR